MVQYAQTKPPATPANTTIGIWISANQQSRVTNDNAVYRLILGFAIGISRPEAGKPGVYAVLRALMIEI